MKRTLARFAFACTLALTAAGASRADTIYWYNWVRNPVSLPTVQQNHPNLAGTGGINLLDLNSSAVQAENDTGNPAADVQSISSATSANKDLIPTTGGHYTLTLTLYAQDPALHPNTASGQVSFAGQLQGTVTALSSNLTDAILSSTDGTGTHVGQNSAKVQVGNTLFTITYSGFAEPGPSNEKSYGAISFHISVAPAIDGQSPEPSSIVLGCLGLALLGGVAWRVRRRGAMALKAMA
jgi:PEP-CTERM motif